MVILGTGNVHRILGFVKTWLGGCAVCCPFEQYSFLIEPENCTGTVLTP
ncbi:MAG: hypothetical protein RL659_1864, partial [Pseudomonadota bacterium]